MNTQSSKVAIVTGASRGIGAAIAERLGRDGFIVVVNFAGSAPAADDVVARITAAGSRAIAVQADVADAQAVKALFDQAQAAFGGVDVLVNNAGVMTLSPIADEDDARLDRMLDINLKGTFNTLREAARRLRDGGRVINFSTSVVGMNLPGYGAYVATKAAVESLTRVLANEMRGRSITVNAVAPGPTATALFLDGKSPELIERLSKMNPLERLAEPEDIAAAVAFLAGPDGAWINGQVLRANGGLV